MTLHEYLCTFSAYCDSPSITYNKSYTSFMGYTKPETVSLRTPRDVFYVNRRPFTNPYNCFFSQASRISCLCTRASPKSSFSAPVLFGTIHMRFSPITTRNALSRTAAVSKSGGALRTLLHLFSAIFLISLKSDGSAGVRTSMTWSPSTAKDTALSKHFSARKMLAFIASVNGASVDW